LRRNVEACADVVDLGGKLNDTAQKTGERNDYSVFECWGLGDDGRAYLIDLIRGKWEAPELERQAIAFWSKHSARKMKVEDKSSGTGLIQSIKKKAEIKNVNFV
jgi:predicted phage terminase large subunit-like protein